MMLPGLLLYIFKPCESIRQIEICRAVVRDTPCGRTLFVRKNTAANVYCTRVGADIIRPRFWQQLVTIHSVGVGDSTHRCRRRRHNMMMIKFSPTTFATYLNEIFYLSQRFGIFFLFEKENACKRKAKQGDSPLYPRERRTAVHSLLFSVGSSAHSPVNSLRSNSTGSCGVHSTPFPRGS